MVQFDSHVQIIRGDIGDIESVGDLKVDGLAFPTASFLRNPHVGAAAVIFRRAGHRLNEHVNKIDVRLDVGQVHATPGFDAGVDKLIHVVGPSGINSNCLRELQRTYRSVLRCIQREKLDCVAMTSISTGNMGLPVDSASWSALCAMQRFMRSTNWTATVAMVCFEPEVYTAFVKNKAKLLAEFNSDSVRIANDVTGSADICKVVGDFSKCQASEYLLPNETVAFSLLSPKEEFTFTNMAMIKLGGESSTTTRRLVQRFDYKENTIKSVEFETAGIADRDCEIKFHIGSKRVSIDIAKGEQTSAQGIYKVLELLSRAQVSNERRWEVSTLGMKNSSEALYLTENSGQTLTKQSDEATAWLYEAYKRTHPHCYRDVIQAAISDLRLADKMAQ
ncbi:hypothetical protein BBJ29_008223 [Phytophthora kernoviae]|uniref:Macro domain-containing protein n=1 Tax=Phytophthora kernoviae TaxID=325452 RepID=A0A3F2RDL5_9STRA|nr:hypothetical protein BBJ29_008223 [Phytophthora kernoviae]RLN53816.1 hypothetical protein BBP00_00009187 [Phytophthora kernoviae]